MRKSILLALAFAASIALAACGSSSSSLTGTTWFLAAGTETSPAWQWNIPESQQASYTITFNTDGSFNAQADCNQVAGTWTSSGNNITITPGPSTLAFCGEGSFDLLYTHLLSTATSYAIAGDQLTLTLSGGSLVYTKVAPTATTTPDPTVAPTATPEPTAAPTPKPTPKPTPTPTAAPTATPRPSGTPRPTAAPTATPRPTPSPTPRPTPAPTPTPGQGLTGPDWTLVAITIAQPPFQGAVPDAQRGSYTVTFNADGSFTAKADCNTVNGTYATRDARASSGDLEITLGAGTIAACGDDSYSDLYLIGLSDATSFAIANGELTITVGADEGSLQYED